MKSILGLSLLPLLAAGSPVIVDTIHNVAAPSVSSTTSENIDDHYMVVFKKHVNQNIATAHHSWVENIHLDSQSVRTELRKRSQTSFKDSAYEGLRHTYNLPGFSGYAGHFHEDVIEQIRSHPDVDFIERDSVVTTMSNTETNAPWGLARISHRDRLGFSNFNKYLYAADGGLGVNVYIIDTGINTEHVDFGGRAHWGKTIPAGSADADGNGHGTHCSGTIGGEKFGVAKNATLYAVKVLSDQGSGTMADVVKGIEYAVDQHQNNVKANKTDFKGSVGSMSLGGGKSRTVELAVNAGVDAGVHFAVAAGNDNQDACSYSPAGAEKPITVGASTLADERAYFSNFGPCTDIFAPGLNILSAWIGSKYATNVISGTSMATPHVAGLVAYFLSMQPNSTSEYAVEAVTTKQLKKALSFIATKGALSDIPKDTPNLLIWNGGGSSNFTKIIDQGGYKAYKNSKSASKIIKTKAKQLKTELNHIAHEIEELIEKY